MNRFFNRAIAVLAVIVIFLAGCSSAPPEPPKLVSQFTIAPGTKGAAAPTITQTPSVTPTIPTATATATDTETPLPTATDTLLPSVTAFPTFTATTPHTPVPLFTATSTRRPTRTPSPDGPTITFTPQTCTLTWFFEPRPSYCPLAPPSMGPAAFQQFENGIMIWFGPEKVIYSIYYTKGNPRWNQFSDEYGQGKPDYDPALQPPEGRLQPVRGFGMVWRNKGGMKERLGWATAPEFGYAASFQLDNIGNRYIQGPTGEIYILIGDKSDWQMQR